MNFILYPFYVVINLIGTILTFPLALVIVLFAKDEMGWVDNATAKAVGPRLPKWLGWFQTWDNSLDGDKTFLSLHKPSWWSKVQWLWRNPFYGFAVKEFDGSSGMYYSGDLGCNEQNPGYLLVTGHGLFQWVYFKKIKSKTLYLNFGWNIRALVDPAFITPTQWVDNTEVIKDWHATFAFSPRLV